MKNKDLLKGDNFDMSTHYVKTDDWRGYTQPNNAICGANDTGSWEDSPCPSEVAQREINAIKARLKNAAIPFREMHCQTSNVFCIHRYLVVAPTFHEAGRKIVDDYLKCNTTRLLYAVDQFTDEKKEVTS